MYNLTKNLTAQSHDNNCAVLPQNFTQANYIIILNAGFVNRRGHSFLSQVRSLIIYRGRCFTSMYIFPIYSPITPTEIS